MARPGVRWLVGLGGIAGASAIVFSVSAWRADDTAPPPSALAAPTVSVAAAEPAPSAATAAASVSAMPASAVLRLPAMDVSRLQRDIQLAMSSDQRGKAGEAARHIQRCLASEREPERQRTSKEEFAQKFSEPVANAVRTIQHQLDASCQAVDAASRAQLVPLLRRSLAEGDKGAAAGLVQALDKNFDPAEELAVVLALRRDALDCDRISQLVLGRLVRRDPLLLTPNEVGALRDQERIQFSKHMDALLRRAEGDPKRRAAVEGMLATFKPPPEADASEVARISAEIQSRCKVVPS